MKHYHAVPLLCALLEPLLGPVKEIQDCFETAFIQFSLSDPKMTFSF